MRFRFICSYMGQADYRVIGGPLHDKRIEIRYTVPALYDRFRGRVFNYSPVDYAHYVGKVKGYMECGTTPIPDEVFNAFVVQQREAHEASRREWNRRHPDWGDLGDYDPQLKGTAVLVKTDEIDPHGYPRYRWELRDLPIPA